MHKWELIFYTAIWLIGPPITALLSCNFCLDRFTRRHMQGFYRARE